MRLCDQKLVRFAYYIEVKEGFIFVKIHLHELFIPIITNTISKFTLKVGCTHLYAIP